MDAARAQRVAALFDQALAVPRAERPAFLQASCGDDDELRQEVRSLLEAYESSSGFFEDLAAGVVAPVSAAVVAQGLADLRPELERLLEGRYRLERELGGGGMSRVFLAEELALGRKVVIKVLPPEAGAPVSAERFRREIQLAAQLQHPHIVPLLTGDSSSRLLYYTMPFIEGESLRTRLVRDGALPVPDAIRIWRDVLDALAYAHGQGVVHRDIKPGNVLLGARYAMVSDFGIARAVEAAAGDADVTGPGLAIGTPAYMAPEQVRGDAGTDHRADIYAAGLVMYEMLEGRLPFGGTSPRELLLARLTHEPRPIARADCPPELAAAVLRCLARDPADRPASAEALLAGLEPPTTPTDSATPGRAPSRRLLPYAAAAAAALGVAGFGVSHLGRGSAAAPPPEATAPSVAVLPLANLSAGTGDATLADGMTEELIAILSRGGRLRIVASTSVRALQERRLEVRQIAESLRVTHVLEGALQKVGSKLRMQVRLVDARDGSTRWSETYDREIGDIFAVQDEIARAVAGELDVQLAGGGVAASQRRRYTPSVVAYEWYLRGKQTALMRTSAGRRQGIEYFTRAIAADSNFAAAYAGLTWLYLNEPGDSPGDYREWDDRATAVALKAVALDSSLAEAHSALGWARMSPSDLTPSETALERAISLDPAVHRGYEGLARVYMLTRRPVEQLAAARRGLEVDPFSVQAAREMALALSMNGRCDEALELLRPLKELTPPAAVAGVVRGQCYARKRMWPEAIAEQRWAMETGARAALGLLGYALARSGKEDEAREILADLLAGRKRSHGAFGIAVVYTGLRDYDQAFAWLEKSMEEGSVRVYIMDPLFEDLHRDPRFDRLFFPGQKR